MIIRDALADDATDLVMLGEAFFAEAGIPERFATLGMPEVGFCPKSFLLSCEMLQRKGVMLVAERGGQVVGMLGAAFVPALWNYGVITAQECWWYVDPSKRKKGQNVGVALLKEFEDRAAAQGVAISAMVAELGLRGKTVGRLYEAKGYAPAESVFWKRLAVH